MKHIIENCCPAASTSMPLPRQAAGTLGASGSAKTQKTRNFVFLQPQILTIEYMNTVRKKISLKPGPPVEDDDFYGRESELTYAWQYYMPKSVSLLLSAPRRVGKSSFAKKMLKIANEKEWKTLYLDLQGLLPKALLLNFSKKR